MNRKILAGLAVAATLFVALFLAGSGDARRKEISSTRRVVIDGRSFVPDESSPDEGSLLKRELDRLGVRLPDGFILPEESGRTHPAFETRLMESQPPVLETSRLPAGLTAERTLRMEGEGMPVDLVFGKLVAPGPSVRSRLLSSGWEAVPTGGGSGGMHVLQITRGKETTIACLDEAEGTFLLFRKWAGKFRTILPLLAGLLLCGFALAAAGRRVATVEKDILRQANPVEVVVASVPIPSGETFGTRNLAKKAIPSSGTGQRNVPASDFELLVGARAKTAIDPGEPVLWTDVEEPFDTDAFSRTILPGRRAMTLGVDTTSSFAGMLHPGDRVDLLVERSGADSADWVRDLPVIAVDRDYNRLAHPTDKEETATVTLMVSPGEGSRIARASGKVHWFLRNPGDNAAEAKGPPGKPMTFHVVEVWKGGVKVSPILAGKEFHE